MTQIGDNSAARKEHCDALEAMIAAMAQALQSDWIGDDLIDGLFQLGMLASDAGGDFEDFSATCLAMVEQLAGSSSELTAAQADSVQREHVQELPGLLALALHAVASEAAAERLAALQSWAQALQSTSGACVEMIIGNTPAEDLAKPLAADEVPNAGLEAEQPALEAAPQAVDPALTAMLLDELDALEEQVGQTLALMEVIFGEQRSDELLDLTELFLRLSSACADVGLLALSQCLADWVPRMNMALIGCADGDLGEASAAIKRLMGALRGYAREPDSPDTALTLVEAVGEPIWCVDDAAPELESLNLALMHVRVVEGSTERAQAPRPTLASADDVALNPPAGINAELLDGLLQELPIQTSAFTAAIANLAGGQGSLHDIEVAQRAAHTLKGAANTVGIPGIANLTHHLEDIFIALGAAERLPGEALADLLIEAGDCLEGMNEALLGLAPAPTDRLRVLQRVLDVANHIDQQGLEAELPAASPPAATSAAISTETEAPTEALAAAAEPLPTPVADGEAAEVTQMVRVPAELLADLLRRVSETMISTARMRDQLTRALDQSSGLRRQNQTLQDLLGELENIVDIRGLGMANAGGDTEFDALEFEQFNELQTLSRQLTEAVTDAREFGKEFDRHLDEMRESMELHQQVQTSIHEAVLQTRMSPVSTIVPRLQRAVRQTARLLDKDVELEVQGAETLMDGNVLRGLSDPLMHVLRNAIDHGLEDESLRSAAGKPAQGRISLSFAREGNSIVVRCRDDGKGLDHAAIRQRAQEMGLISADQPMSPEEVSRLILRHGFSTRSAASQVSGRGIGMDAVLTAVSELKGTLLLHSSPGKGLMVELRLPVSLVASHAMLVETQNGSVAVSTSGLQDLVYLNQDDIQTDADGRLFAMLEGRKLPMTDIENMLGMPRRDEQRSGYPVMLVQLDTGALRAVRVSKVLENRDIVMADLGRFVPRREGILGATLLGDGTVSPVVDLRELASAGAGILAWNRRQLANTPQVAQAPTQRTALVVDDSVSARRATAQLVRDMGFEVRTAIDGLDAIGVLEKWVPDVVLTDMEMPRINGLELASHMRSRDALKQVPIVMITSRSMEKHRQQAQRVGVSSYFVKPFKDESLSSALDELVGAQH